MKSELLSHWNVQMREESDALSNSIVNAALFSDHSDTAFLKGALQTYLDETGCYIVTPDADLLPQIALAQRLDYPDIALRPEGLFGELVFSDLMKSLQRKPDLACLLVDMTWCLNMSWGARALEHWGALVDQVCAELGIIIVSLYNKELIVEEQMQAAFRVHRQFLAPSGKYENPHWMPRHLIEGATLDEQLGFLLGRVVPEFADRSFHNTDLPNAARGATPGWLPPPRHSVAVAASTQRWHIHCLGRLRVYVGGNMPVNWQISGSAPKKSRALFAYLLNRGETGTHIDQISEFLWPDDGQEDSKRARARHTISMLRKTLGSADTVKRSGEFYKLAIPSGSWIDIKSFEQLCRRGLALFRHGDLDAALRVYHSAEQLYEGDLFEDLPLEYVQSEVEDWCMPRRIWLREMMIKLQYDLSHVLRQKDRIREAGEHCHKALSLDPINDLANIEVMHVLHMQGRREAMTRQFRQYQAAMQENGMIHETSDVHEVYTKLLEQEV